LKPIDLGGTMARLRHARLSKAHARECLGSGDP
jgi:hypothetical protein